MMAYFSFKIGLHMIMTITVPGFLKVF